MTGETKEMACEWIILACDMEGGDGRREKGDKVITCESRRGGPLTLLTLV